MACPLAHLKKANFAILKGNRKSLAIQQSVLELCKPFLYFLTKSGVHKFPPPSVLVKDFFGWGHFQNHNLYFIGMPK